MKLEQVMLEPSLENGAVVVAATDWAREDATIQRRVILCAYRSQWVTWVQFRTATRTTECWGHYFDYKKGTEALADFQARSKGV